MHLGTLSLFRTPLAAQKAKSPPAMQETRVRSLGQEDLLGKGMATHSSMLAWRIPWTERSLLGYSPRGHKESDRTERVTQKALHGASLLPLIPINTALGTTRVSAKTSLRTRDGSRLS